MKPVKQYIAEQLRGGATFEGAQEAARRAYPHLKVGLNYVARVNRELKRVYHEQPVYADEKRPRSLDGAGKI